MNFADVYATVNYCFQEGYVVASVSLLVCLSVSRINKNVD